MKSLLILQVGLAVLAGGAPLRAQSRPFTAEDMLAVERISGRIAVSPAGDRVAYVLPDLSDEWNVLERRQVGRVHVQRISGSAVGTPTPVGPPDRKSSFPVFSPDGSFLAFYVEGPEGGRLAVWDSRSGEIRELGRVFSGRAFASPEWASETRIVYSRPMKPEEAAEPPRVEVLRSTDRTLPGDAWFADRRRAGLAWVDLSSGAERTLLEDTAPLRRFAVSPHGRWVLAELPSPATAGVYRGEVRETFLWSLEEGGRRQMTASGERIGWFPDGRLAWRCNGRWVTLRPSEVGPAEGGRPEPFLPGLHAALTDLVWSPAGGRFASLVPDPSRSDPEIEPPQPGMFSIARPFMDVYLYRASGRRGAVTNLTAQLDDQVSDPVWNTDGSALYFRAVDNRTYDETIYRYDVSLGRLRVLAHGEESYGRLRPVPGGLLFAAQSATAPPDLWRVADGGGGRTRVTDLNPQLAAFEFSRPTLFHFRDSDGERLGALLYRPTGVKAGERFPVITYVYEKLTPGIHQFRPRQQIFATHGFAVLMPNVKVKVGRTGMSFVDAVVPAVEAVRAMGFTNGRFCLWGGSFGAYATSYVITQTSIFRCAVSRATPPDLFRNWASGRDRDSDNIERGQARMGGSPFEVMDRYLSQSAFFHLDQIQTPVLLLHGVKDHTILYGEGAMMFYALRRLGKTATLVSYREGDHSLSRHSREDTLDVHRRMLEWFNRYLRPTARPTR